MEGTIGEIRMFAGKYAPKNWAFCKGQTLTIASNGRLHSILGTTFGGDGTTNFMLPNMQGRLAVGAGQLPDGGGTYALGQSGGSETVNLTLDHMPAHSHNVGGTVALKTASTGESSTAANNYPAVASGDYYVRGNGSVAMQPANVSDLRLTNTGGSTSMKIMQPIQTLNYIICLEGKLPQLSETSMQGTMAEIRYFGGNFAPKDWMFCDGAILEISEYSHLYSLLGTNYGGDGQTTFALPNFQGRVAVGTGTGKGLDVMDLGQMTGSENVTLTPQTMARHDHELMGTVNWPVSSEAGDTANPSGAYLAGNGSDDWNPTPVGNMTMTPVTANMITGTTKGPNQPFSILQPYLVLTAIICTGGIFPSRR